jgi:hypothetical protein
MREVYHKIWLLLDSPLPNIRLYKKSILEANELKIPEETIATTIGAGNDLTKYLTLWVTYHHSTKNDGTWKMCINYRALNKIALNNKYHLPMIIDLLDQWKHTKYFTKLDLKPRYY